jgi:hypothetical protein
MYGHSYKFKTQNGSVRYFRVMALHLVTHNQKNFLLAKVEKWIL